MKRNFLQKVNAYIVAEWLLNEKKNLRFRFFFHLALFVIFGTGTAITCPIRNICGYSPHRKELLLLIPVVDINYKLRSKSMLISTPGSRFPRATLQLPRKQKSLPTGSSAGTALTRPTKNLVAFPAGQGRLRQHYIARRKLICIFEESTALRSNQPSQK